MPTIKHRKSGTPEHDAWVNMWDRCRRPRHPAYKDYGGRGITVDPHWHSFENFFADMGPRPSPRHSLERVKNELGYSKDNCVWALRLQQANNMRSNNKVTLGGKTQSVSAWARELNISRTGLRQRLANKWPEERILMEVPRGSARS